MADDIPFTSLIINGQHRPASTNTSYEVHNPYSQALVGYAAAATSRDCRDAIESAACVFPKWEQTPVATRRDILLRAADLIATDKYRQRYRTAAQNETAIVDYFSVYELNVSSANLRHYATITSTLHGETFASIIPGGHVVAQRRAIGVILAISPWNAPLVLTIRAIAIPLMCGNTVVLKCSEVSPQSQMIVVDLLHEAGLPDGVLNFVSIAPEDAPSLTAEIIAHPAIRKINFTGSDRVGRLIAIEAAKYLKPCVLELGGKAPVIVLDDADIPTAARAIVTGAFRHSGQICMSTERVIAQRNVFGMLLDSIKDICKTVKAGNPIADPSVKLSALFNESSAENILSMIKEAQSEGAHVVLGDLERTGAVLQPHLVTNVKPGMRLWDRESFGPVIAFAEADTIDEAVELANASDYSLTASLWTNNLNTAMNVATRIRSGYMNINGSTIHSEIQRGHGGLGGSTGYGHFDVNNFTQVRMIVIHPSGTRPDPLLD